MDKLWITLCISCEYPVDSIVPSPVGLTGYHPHFDRAITCFDLWKAASALALRGASNYITLTITIKKGARFAGQKLTSGRCEAVKSGRQGGQCPGQGSAESSRRDVPPGVTANDEGDWPRHVRHETGPGRHLDGAHRARSRQERLHGANARKPGPGVIQRVQSALQADFDAFDRLFELQPETRSALLAAVLAVSWENAQAYVVVFHQGEFAPIVAARSLGFFGCAVLIGHRVMIGIGIMRPVDGEAA